MSKKICEIDSMSELMAVVPSNETEKDEILVRMRELLTPKNTGPSHAKVVNDHYVVESVVTKVRPVDGNLVPCKDDDTRACGTFVLVAHHGFTRQDNSLKIGALDNRQFKAEGQLKQVNLSWAHGSWALIANWTMGNGGPTISETYTGLVGDKASGIATVPTFNALAPRESIFGRDKLVHIAEGLIGQLWGFSELPVVADEASMTNCVARLGRIHKFGVTNAAGTVGRKVLRNGTVVQSDGKLAGGTAGTAGTVTAGGDLVAEAQARVAARRAQAN